ncbi:proline-rich protein HaeIII subfamily 1-like [Falco cherrug]|uniref:proline-rich protein HaeIII subfamily 1-like n=1 Tax=Falco cherrug TaxID=345164 RepID=UPI00247A3A25|nr:proline-rich protein HaeIII subfamily 1-like [Falco cherrug]
MAGPAINIRLHNTKREPAGFCQQRPEPPCLGGGGGNRPTEPPQGSAIDGAPGQPTDPQTCCQPAAAQPTPAEGGAERCVSHPHPAVCPRGVRVPFPRRNNPAAPFGSGHAPAEAASRRMAPAPSQLTRPPTHGGRRQGRLKQLPPPRPPLAKLRRLRGKGSRGEGRRGPTPAARRHLKRLKTNH